MRQVFMNLTNLQQLNISMIQNLIADVCLVSYNCFCLCYSMCVYLPLRLLYNYRYEVMWYGPHMIG